MSQPPRKKLRKGTKSCVGCRRRKVKCTYEDHDGDAPCDGCEARGIECESQENVIDLGKIEEPTRERVDRLEATIQSLSDRLEDTVKSLTESVAELQSSRLMSSNRDTTPIPACRREECAASQCGCFESVQDENEGGVGYVDPVEESHERKLYHRERILSAIPNEFGEDAQDRLTAQLTSAVPSRSDLLILTASSVDWWQIHKALMPDPPIKSRIELIERHEGLSNPSIHPATIATWLLCLAMCFLQLPTDFDYSALDSIPEATSFVPRIVKEVGEMLAKDDLAGSLEGIECAVVFAQIQKFIGRPKKGWLVIRRAIAFAELLKLPSSRAALMRLKRNERTRQNEEYLILLKRRYNAWTALHAIDRLLCLLLGTPSARPDVSPHIDPHDPHAGTKRIIWVQSEIHNQIVARDQLDSESEAYLASQRIVEKCQALARTFPPEWKHVDRWAAYDAKTASSMLMQNGHSYLVLRATAPYLNGGLARDCLQACREILRRYFAVRTRLVNGAFLSRSFEVHAFTASVILLLHGDKSWQNPLGDTALLENAKAAMLKAPKGEGVEVLTRRMIGCLEALQRFVEGEIGGPGRLRLRVPILGGVEVGRGEGGKILVTMLGVGGYDRVVDFDFDKMDEDWELREG